jgi:hypothetical protein
MEMTMKAEPLRCFVWTLATLAISIANIATNRIAFALALSNLVEINGRAD